MENCKIIAHGKEIKNNMQGMALPVFVSKQIIAQQICYVCVGVTARVAPTREIFLLHETVSLRSVVTGNGHAANYDTVWRTVIKILQ